MCIIILVCLKKFIYSILREDLILMEIGNGRIFLIVRLKFGNYSDTPFLAITAALLQSIMPIAIGQQWSMFNRFKLKPTTKSVNADSTVKKARRASATNEDHNFIT